MEECPLKPIKYNVHTIFQDKPIEDVKEISKHFRLPIHLVLVNLDGNMNIAMCVRTCAVMGISDVWIIGKRNYDARPEVGGRHYVNVHKLDKIEDPYKFFVDKGIQPFLIEQGGSSLEEFSFKAYIKSPVCFIMGCESTGISPEWEKSLDKAPRLSISQYGMIRSLNVSVAASIVLYEYIKQLKEGSTI